MVERQASNTISPNPEDSHIPEHRIIAPPGYATPPESEWNFWSSGFLPIYNSSGIDGNDCGLLSTYNSSEIDGNIYVCSANPEDSNNGRKTSSKHHPPESGGFAYSGTSRHRVTKMYDSSGVGIIFLIICIATNIQFLRN